MGGRVMRITTSAVFLALLIAMPGAIAEDHFENLGHSIRVEYQYTETGEIDTSVGDFDIGVVDTQVFLLSGVFAINERWTVFGSLPYVRKRHKGAGVHDPNVDFVAFQPPDLRVVDDGEYHGDWQDIYVGTQYRAIDGPFSLSPFIGFGAPVSNYPIYGNAILGRHAWEAPVGVSMEFTPYFSDWYFQADVAYVFSEEVLGVNLDYWHWYASASYFITPRFAPRVFLTRRDARNALTWPEDYTEDLDTEEWFHHDRTLKHSYLNAGVGFDFIVSERYAISGTYYETIDPDHVAEITEAFTFALTRRF